ncbi:MAG: Mur ligase domain-containing protein [Candidatus Omnitrophota bacterium]
MKAYKALNILGKNPEKYEFDDFDLKGLSLDSRTVSADYCFFAIKGTSSDGHDFIKAAIEKGARLIVYETGNKPINSGLFNSAVFIEVANARISVGKLAAEYFGNPSNKLTSIGITGTNGKTTISYLIEHILKKKWNQLRGNRHHPV